jgi:hypothetical protein
MGAEPTRAGSPRRVHCPGATVSGRALGVVPFVGVLALAIAVVIRLAGHGTSGFAPALLEDSITYLIGVQGIVIGSGHLFTPEPVARSIDWPAGTPWQWEVWLASLSFGVLGVMATSFGHAFWLATIVAFSVFYLGAAAGHVREMVVRHNFSPGNAGPIFFFDVLVPAYLIVLYAVVV